jgi:hypothetical protein
LLQLKIFTGRSDAVEKEVNSWLESREAQKYEVTGIQTSYAMSEGLVFPRSQIVIIYEDEPNRQVNYGRMITPSNPDEINETPKISLE